MLQVDHIVKRYGAHLAVDDVSLAVERRQVLGFLGCNGAGKSTTMNIIIGYLAPTSGRVLWHGQDARRMGETFLSEVGYLPEMPPLYPDATVEKYLNFVCGLKRIRRSAHRKHIDQLCELTSIGVYHRREIRKLSKGYRQRVGLAQAPVGNPELVILDEPMLGLDPEQIVGIRELIRELGREHAVILSCHILSEIQDVCSMLAILRKGRIVAAGTMSEIAGPARREDCRLRLRNRVSSAREALEMLPGPGDAHTPGGGLRGVSADQRLWSAERRQRTDQLLCCSPTSLAAIVMGKFLAAVEMMAIALAGTGVYIPVLARYAALQPGIIAVHYLVFFCWRRATLA